MLGLREEDITFTGKDEAAPLGPQLARLAALPASRVQRAQPAAALHRTSSDRWTRETASTKNRQRRPVAARSPRSLAAELAAQLAQWPRRGRVAVHQPAGTGRQRRQRARGQDPTRHPGGAPEAIGASLIPAVVPHRRGRGRCDAAAGHRATHMLRHHRVRVLRDLGWREEEIADWIGDTEQTLTRVYGKRERTSMSDRADELAAGREAPSRRLRAVDE